MRAFDWATLLFVVVITWRLRGVYRWSRLAQLRLAILERETRLTRAAYTTDDRVVAAEFGIDLDKVGGG